MSYWEDLIDPTFKNFTNTSCSSFRLFYFWIINNSFFTLKLKFNFKKLGLIFFFTVNLIVKMIQGEYNTITNTISNNSINVFCVFFPLRLLFIKLNSIIDLFQKFMYDNTTIFDIDKLVSYDSLKNIVILLRRNWFVFPINHWSF